MLTACNHLEDSCKEPKGGQKSWQFSPSMCHCHPPPLRPPATTTTRMRDPRGLSFSLVCSLLISSSLNTKPAC